MVPSERAIGMHLIVRRTFNQSPMHLLATGLTEVSIALSWSLIGLNQRQGGQRDVPETWQKKNGQHEYVLSSEETLKIPHLDPLNCMFIFLLQKLIICCLILFSQKSMCDRKQSYFSYENNNSWTATELYYHKTTFRVF